MLVNSPLTVYHKGFDETSRTETWARYNYDKVWFFGGRGSGINKGYDNANDFDCRLSYDEINNLSVDNFAIGDIVIPETVNIDIQTQEDLNDYLIYNITSINNNDFGNNKHIHIGGK